MGITVRGLMSLKPGRWLSEDGKRGQGALRAKGGPHGARFYFRYRTSAGDYDDLPLGSFDSTGTSGMTLGEATDRAGALRKRYLNGDRDLRAILEAEQREAVRQRDAVEREAQARAAAEQATLGALLIGYADQLVRAGKTSAVQVRGALKRHVEQAWPILWATPAENVTADDLLAVVARVADEGKLREASKLRAYLRAAYAAGIRAKQDARSLPALRELRLTANPARDLVTIDGASQARERALSVAELRAYWRRISAAHDIGGALLRFHLLTGGQRIEQLARVTVTDYDVDLRVIRLRDTKGRRRQPRIHDVPLSTPAAQAMRAMQGGKLGPYVFTVTAGESGAAYSTVQQRLRPIVAAMADAGELDKGPFTVGDLRRTVETRLAAEGIGMDVRAQLQSHGLGGVQGRHYDRHDYLPEKKKALETLYRLLTGAAATVTPIRANRRSTVR